MLLTLNCDFELWTLCVEAETRKQKLKIKAGADSEAVVNLERDILLSSIDERIALHLVNDFKDKRKSFKTLLEAVKVKHFQLSRPADLHEAFRKVKLSEPKDSFPVARELKRLAVYVNGDNEFLVQHFIESIEDYDFKLLIQQKVTSSERRVSIDELADFLSQMPPKPRTTCSAVGAKTPSIWDSRVCYNCGKMGHGVRFCREVKKRCANCKKWGHVVEQCPKN